MLRRYPPNVPILMSCLCTYLSLQDKLGDDIKDQVLWDLDRTSAEDKLRDLLSRDNDIKDYIKLQVR